jgi:hypothetical protein
MGRNFNINSLKSVVTICTTFFNILNLHSAHTACLCVQYGSRRKQYLFPQTALSGWALWWRRDVFPVKYKLSLYIILRINSDFKSCVEVGSNTSAVALRVVGGDEKGTQCLGV